VGQYLLNLEKTKQPISTKLKQHGFIDVYLFIYLPTSERVKWVLPAFSTLKPGKQGHFHNNEQGRKDKYENAE